MRAETVLHSVVFQLTPTRTRYDLVIVANGKTEKIASGLLEPFLGHLKTAKDQIEKGGYSIKLEPRPGTDASWFTKDTVERFVRYVSTPEVLERVNTLELEISQIDEAITIQGYGNLCSSNVEDHQGRGRGSRRGSTSPYSADTEKVKLLSKNGKYRRLSTGSITQEDDSRCQLLKVLEGRKIVLRKEQEMAFARATAAGFDMNHMENLIFFARSFGASRLLEACLSFVELWKSKHKNGQLLEVSSEDVAFQSELTSMKVPATVSSRGDRHGKKFTVKWPVPGETLAADINDDGNQAATSNTEDNRLSSDPQSLLAQQRFCGQIQNPMLSHWASQGPHVSQSYPLQGMPYYHSYPALRVKTGAVTKPANNHWEIDCLGIVSHNGEDQGDESDKRRSSHKKVSHSGKRRKNTKHNTREGSDKSISETPSASDVEFEEEIHDARCEGLPTMCRDSARSLNSQGGSAFRKTSNVPKKDPVVEELDGDTGNWQTFQKLLLRVHNETTKAVDGDVFSGEETQAKRRSNKSQADPSTLPSRNNINVEIKTVGYNTQSGRSGFLRAEGDEFMVQRQMRRTHREMSPNSISQNEYQNASSLQRPAVNSVHDESFIVPFRSGLCDEGAKDLHSAHEDRPNSRKAGDKHSYEPNVLRILPSRGLEKASSSYDPAKDFDMQISIQKGIKKETRGKEDVSKRAKEGLKGSEKERSLSVQFDSQKRKMDQMTVKGKSSKLNQLADAKARAEKLRAYKAEIQKAKKEKEEEERKRIEALKRERQKRIAARSGSNIAKTPHLAPATKLIKPTGHSSSSCNDSKFRDATPQSSSPLSKTARTSKSPMRSQTIGASVTPKSSLHSRTPMSSQKLGVAVTPKTSPHTYKSSKFSDVEPMVSSPLVKLIRSNQNVCQSAGKSPETTVKKQIRFNASSAPTKRLPSSTKSAAQSTRSLPEPVSQKFCSSSGSQVSEFPRMKLSPSPLQKLPARTSSAWSSGSDQNSRLSASPQSKMKRNHDHLLLKSSAASIQAERVSDPKGIKISPSRRPISGNQVVNKKTMLTDSQGKPKPGTLSNIVGKSTEPSRLIKNKPGMIQRKNEIGNPSLLTTGGMKATEVPLEVNNNEDVPIVEKAVLILENKTTTAITDASKAMTGSGVEPSEGSKSRRPAIYSRVADAVREVDNSKEFKSEAYPGSYEIVDTPVPNQTHLAQALCSDDPTASSIEQIEELVDQSVAVVGPQRKTHPSRTSERHRDVHGKPYPKVSPMGFKELLKFRRKGQKSASLDLNAKPAAVHTAKVTRSSNNDLTLKDLMSEDSRADSTPAKASRSSFSLFSPFQNKSSEKRTRT